MKLNNEASVCVSLPFLGPVVSQVCILSGKRIINCTSEGRNLQFTWKLNNKSLPITPENISSAADPVNNQSASIITLEAYEAGNVTCEVKSEFSSSETSVPLTDCKGKFVDYQVNLQMLMR